MAQDFGEDTVPPTTDAAKAPAPHPTTLAPDPAAALRPSPPPEVDVPALTSLLDGRYAEVRDLVNAFGAPPETLRSPYLIGGVTS